jgi:phosphohistidine phosphatase
MKTLLLVRHAKSSWDSPVISDFDRPLNDRGKHDAPMMAKRLLEKNIKIDGFIASPAKRAKKTAKVFADEYGKNKDKIILLDELYAAGVDVFYDVMAKADDKFDTIAIFSHNPGITDFANSLTDVKIDNLPTCGVFGVKIKTKKWKEAADADKDFWFVDFPKAGQD